MQAQADTESPPARMLTVHDVMIRLNVSRPTAYEMVRLPGFPSLRCGRCWRIPQEAFLKWLQSEMAKKDVVRD